MRPVIFHDGSRESSVHLLQLLHSTLTTNASNSDFEDTVRPSAG